MSNFKGKAIYNPSGKAGEYARWACNFYVGCSNGCTYCYCKKGILKGVMGMDTPQLKKCFKDESDALSVFVKELHTNMVDLQEHGLFFSFTTDPCLKETISLTQKAISIALNNNVPCKILTKCTNWVTNLYGGMPMLWNNAKQFSHLLAFGFTLTGHDGLEPKASTNAERIEAMKMLHDDGFMTFASVEPIIDFESSLEMIKKTVGFCDLYKIGLMSGKTYDEDDLKYFFIDILRKIGSFNSKIYFKDSLLGKVGIERNQLPTYCVNRDYNMFKNK